MLLRFFVFAALLSAVATSCGSGGCEEQEAKKLMGNLFRKKIKLPEKLTLLNGEYVSEANMLNQNEPDYDYYVLKLFSMDCDKCINALRQAQDYIKRNKTAAKIKYIFVASGYINVFVKDAIQKFHFDYPLYVTDNYNAFYVDNGLPAGNEGTYGTMLINKNNELIVFGALYDNEKAQAVYNRILNCEK